MKTIDLVDFEKKVVKTHKSPFHTFEWREFACGWGAAFVNVSKNCFLLFLNFDFFCNFFFV